MIAKSSLPLVVGYDFRDQLSCSTLSRSLNWDSDWITVLGVKVYGRSAHPEQTIQEPSLTCWFRMRVSAVGESH